MASTAPIARMRVSPRARANAFQLKPIWLTAAHRARIWSSGTANSQLGPSTRGTAAGAKSAAPTPAGKPHRSAIRFDFENDSKSRSRRSFTAHIAGYIAWVTMSSTRVVYWVICEQNEIAPTDAMPSTREAIVIGIWNISTTLTWPKNNGHEKLAYSRIAPFS